MKKLKSTLSTKTLETTLGVHNSKLYKLLISISFCLVSWSVLSINQGAPYPRLESIPAGLSPQFHIIASIYICLLLAVLLYDFGIDSYTFILFIIVFFVLISLPNISNLVFYGRNADSMIHVGFLADVLSDGTLSREIIYPALFVISAFISLIFDWSTEMTILVVPPLTVLYLAIGIFMATRQMGANNRVAYALPFVLLFASVNSFGIYMIFKPVTTMSYLMPLVIWLVALYLSADADRRYIWVTLVVIVGTFLLHPLISLPLLFVTSGLSVVTIPSTRMERFLPNIWNPVYLLLIIGLISFGWILFWAQSAGQTIGTRLLLFVDDPIWFIKNLSLFAGRVADAEQGQNLGIDIGRYFVQLFGPVIAFCTVGVVCTVGYTYYKTRRNELTQIDVVATLWILSMTLFGVVNAVANVINIAPVRLMPFVAVPSMFYIASVVTIDRRIFYVVVAFLVIVSAVGVINLYSGPQNLNPNPQITNAERQGMSWFFHSKNREYSTINYRTHQHRFGAYILGMNELGQRPDVPRRLEQRNLLDKQLAAGGNLSCPEMRQPEYTILSEFDYWYVTRYYPAIGFEQGFNEIEKSSARNKLYDNSDLRLYLTSGQC